MPTVHSGAGLAPRIAAASPYSASCGRRLLVVGHRGASGYRPEHTLASYELAARMGADYVEPDLVSTKDGVLICRHEPEIGGTTDVASRPEFASRRATKVLDGIEVTGWWAEDFTLNELKTLRAIERFPATRQSSSMYDGRFAVPTFTEVLDLCVRLCRELRREIGVFPETKHPTYFQKLGLGLERPLLAALRCYKLNTRRAPVCVQSFETTNLQQLRQAGLRTKVTQLYSATGAPYDLIEAGEARTYADLATPAGLRAVGRYATGIGPEKEMVIPTAANGTLSTPTSLVADAHAAGLHVIPYTFRAENQFLSPALRRGCDPNDYGSAIDEQIAFLRSGIDGLITDQPDIGVVARTEAALVGAA